MALAADDSGRSQGEVAEVLGVDGGQLSRWKNGRAVPDLAYVAGLATELGVSAHWLLLGTGAMRPEDPALEVQAFREIKEIVERTIRREL